MVFGRGKKPVPAPLTVDDADVAAPVPSLGFVASVTAPSGIGRRVSRAMVGKDRAAQLDAVLPRVLAAQRFLADNKDLLDRLNAGEQLSPVELDYFQEQVRILKHGPVSPE